VALKICRSLMIFPVNVDRFVAKAHLRRADALVLDLEDSVPAAEKDQARRLVKEAIPLVGRGGSEVMVRVNNDPALLQADLEASIWPGLEGIMFPMAESGAQVADLAAAVETLERSRGLEPGRIRFCLLIETPLGLLNIREIAQASPRTESLGPGVEDYCLKIGVEPSVEGEEILPLVQAVITVSKALGIMPLGVVGSIAGFKDAAVFERSAERARQMGCEGSQCIHPDQVRILNRVFSPDPAKVAQARRVVEAFEEGLKRGVASVSLDGRMVDVPVYTRARLLFDRAEAVAALEARKTAALARLNQG